MPTNERIYFLDATRAILMFLGIPYHAALLYAPFSTFLVPSPDGSRFLAVLAEGIHIFRMPLFFMVAGFFGAMLLEHKEPGQWYRGRLTRLGVPLVTATLILNPVIMAATAKASHGKVDLVEELTTSGNQWVMHLWFLPVLIGHCAVLALLVYSGSLRKLATRATLMTRHPLKALALAWFLWGGYGGAVMLMGSRIPDVWIATATFVSICWFFPFFVFGALMRRSPRMFALMTHCTVPASIVTVLAIAFLLATGWGGSTTVNILRAYAIPVAAIGCGCWLFTACRLWLNAPSKTVNLLVAASFTVYLVHMPLMGLLELIFVRVRVPPLAEWACLVSLVALGSLAIHESLRKSSTLLLLFNGSRSAGVPLPTR